MTHKLFLSILFVQVSLHAEQNNFQEIRDSIINNYSCSNLQSCARIKNNLNKEKFSLDHNVIFLQSEAPKNPEAVKVLEEISQKFMTDCLDLTESECYARLHLKTAFTITKWSLIILLLNQGRKYVENQLNIKRPSEVEAKISGSLNGFFLGVMGPAILFGGYQAYTLYKNRADCRSLMEMGRVITSPEEQLLILKKMKNREHGS